MVYSHPPSAMPTLMPADPIGLLYHVSTKDNECLHNLSRSQLNNIRRMSRDVLHVSVLPPNSLMQVTIHPVNTAYNPA